MVMALQVLEGCNGHSDWIVSNVMHCFGVRVANGTRIKQMHETLIHIVELRHVLRFVQESILPCAVGVGGAEDFLRPIQCFGALNDPTVFTWSYAARGGKPGDPQRLIIHIEGDFGVLHPGRPIVEIGDFVVTETVHMVLVKPVKVRRLDILTGKLLAEVNLGAERTSPIDHGTQKASILVDQMVGEGRINVLIDYIENDRDSCMMAGIDQTLESLHATPTFTRSKVVQRPIPPVEVQLQTRDWHQLQARDAKALEVRQAFDDPVKGTVELFDMQLVDHQIFQFRDFPGIISPHKVCNRARSDEGRKLTHIIRCAGKGVSKPASDHVLRGSSGNRLEELVAVQIGARLPKIGPRPDRNGDLGMPEIIWRADHRR